MIREIRSKINNKILHLVCKPRILDEENIRKDLVLPDNFIQCAFLGMNKGKTFPPHKHIKKERTYKEQIAQESWVVIRGSVKCFFYDLDDQLLETAILNPGDASFTLEGGHTYEILEDNTAVYEYKTGPYEGQELDKEFI
jgi:cupin fold WbuC family metalloprotein